jgi:hypothetical protein
MTFCNCDLTISPCKGGHGEDSVDVQIDRISERIEMLEIANKVYREHINSIALRINLLKGLVDERD